MSGRHRIVGVIQARMASTRLPGKVLYDIGGEPLLAWTVTSVRAIPGMDEVVIATTTEPEDDAIVDLAEQLGVASHRGPLFDVLARCYGAVAPFEPDIVVRQTADNAYADPDVAGSQIRTLVEGGFDYVGIKGWPIGIAAEAVWMEGLATAHREATDPADREHVMPYLYRHPDRFRVGVTPRERPGPEGWDRRRYTIDTTEDLELAHEIARRLGHGSPVHLEELEAILEADPALYALNKDVVQVSYREAQKPAD